MATVATKPITADEFYEWVHLPENRDRFFELERGEVVEMPPPGKYHGFVCLNIGSILRDFAMRRKKGYAVGNDAGMVVEREPDTVRGPDVSYYEDTHTPETMERKYALESPVLVVVVLSPNDRPGKTDRRVKQYLKRGVRLVWIVDPEDRLITIHRPGQDLDSVGESEELTGNDVLPDFRCRVAEFFAMPGQA